MTMQTILTVDVVVVDGDKVLLIQRRNEPFQSMWALPGGKVEESDPTLEYAAERELYEEAGIIISDLRQIGTFGNVGRDPRPGRWVSVAYLVEIEGKAPQATAGSDATDAQWFPMTDLPIMAFDHANIVTTARTLLAIRAHQETSQQGAPSSFQEMMNEARHRLEDETVSFHHDGKAWQVQFPPYTKVMRGAKPSAWYYLLEEIVYAYDGECLDVMGLVSEERWKERFANAPYILDAA